MERHAWPYRDYSEVTVKDLRDERSCVETAANVKLPGTATVTKYRWLMQMGSGGRGGEMYYK